MRARFILLAAALIAFGASLASGFHFDDYAIFDPNLTTVSGWTGAFTLRQTRPLTYLTFWLNYAIGGGDPILYHAVNLGLHLGAVWLAYECLRRLMTEAAAVAAVAIFALHPLQAEAVDYVWARSIVLATLLCLAAMLEWMKGREWVAVAWFAAALLAKEEVAAFPVVLWWVTRKDQPAGCFAPPAAGRASARPIAVMLLLSIIAAARTVYATYATPGSGAGLQAGITPAKYFLAQGPVILRYLRMVIVPYGFTVDPDIRVPPVWLGALAWAVVAGITFMAWRYSRWALAGLILLIPSSTIFPAADLAADRRMYFPLLAFGAAAAPWLTRAWAAGAVAAILVILSFLRTQVWMTERSLWSEAVERAPEKVRPKVQLARALPAAKALELLAQARTLAPYDASVAAETGKTYLAEGQMDAALEEFGRALALDPHDARNYNNRGVALAGLGQADAARADFERALRMDPSLAEARQNLEKLGR
jgi:tetratricopeptide (TPR) repeat protein